MSYPKPKRKRKKPIHINKIIREEVLKRDNYTCQITGEPAVDLHHILFKSLGGNNTAYNLISLSRRGHNMPHKDGKKWFKILFKMQKKHYPNLTIEMLKK